MKSETERSSISSFLEKPLHRLVKRLQLVMILAMLLERGFYFVFDYRHLRDRPSDHLDAVLKSHARRQDVGSMLLCKISKFCR